MLTGPGETGDFEVTLPHRRQAACMRSEIMT